jgi:hypothetical protein
MNLYMTSFFCICRYSDLRGNLLQKNLAKKDLLDDYRQKWASLEELSGDFDYVGPITLEQMDGSSTFGFNSLLA